MHACDVPCVDVHCRDASTMTGEQWVQCPSQANKQNCSCQIISTMPPLAANAPSQQVCVGFQQGQEACSCGAQAPFSTEAHIPDTSSHAADKPFSVVAVIQLTAPQRMLESPQPAHSQRVSPDCWAGW